MPRDGSGVYSLPPGTKGVTDTTIESTKYNNFTADVERYLNEPTPIIAGGTGANNAAAARDNLDAEVAMQTVTNYDSHNWEAGSFSSSPGATGAPNAGSYFYGTCVGSGASLLLEAFDMSDGLTPHTKWTRAKSTTWGAWSIAQSGTFVAKSGDTMSGELRIAGLAPHATLALNKSAAGGVNQLAGMLNGVTQWVMRIGDTTLGDFTIRRHNDAGVEVDVPLNISRSDGSIQLKSPVYLDTASVTNAVSLFMRKNNLFRWQIQTGGGSDISDFAVHRYDNAGNIVLPAPFGIRRADGAILTKDATTRVFASGSGSYTTPAACVRIRVRIVGGGGGGGGGNGGAGGAGGVTTFGAMIAGGGNGSTPGGASGANIVSLSGGGGNYPTIVMNATGGGGGNTPFGGAGFGIAFNNVGGDAIANTGSGGGGGGTDGTTSLAGAGGGGGGYCESILLAGTYSYAVGAGGAKGTAGAGGKNGGLGGSGGIWIEEYYV